LWLGLVDVAQDGLDADAVDAICGDDQVCRDDFACGEGDGGC